MKLVIIEVFIFGFMLGVLVSQLEPSNLNAENLNVEPLSDDRNTNNSDQSEDTTDYKQTSDCTPTVTEPKLPPIRITCLITTEPQQYNNSIIYVKETWAKRCDNYVFYSHMLPNYNKTEGVLEFNLNDTRLNSNEKSFRILQHAWDNFGDETDWFLYSDDRNHIIIENLRYMLTNYSAEDPISIGNLYRKDNIDFCYGASGFVFSRHALQLMVNAIQNDDCAALSAWAYDFTIGKCMEVAGVERFEDTDELGKRRFFPYEPDKHIFLTSKRAQDFEDEFRKDNITHESIIISDYPVSFRFIGGGRKILLSEYFAYHARVFGVTN